MTTAGKHCQRCGAILPSDDGICERCGTPYGDKTEALEVSAEELLAHYEASEAARRDAEQAHDSPNHSADDSTTPAQNSSGNFVPVAATPARRTRRNTSAIDDERAPSSADASNAKRNQVLALMGVSLAVFIALWFTLKTLRP